MKCPKCNSLDTKFNGNSRIRQSDNILTKQLYCFSCKKNSTIDIGDADKELIEQNVRYKKQTQKFQDTNRIERKAFRENARIENAIEEYSKELIEQNKQFAKELSKIKVPEIKENKLSGVGVAQISDWHANEIINLPHNKFDFKVLSARVKKFAEESIIMFKAYGINDVLIAHTGDILNSDRRLDELLNQSINRSKASILTQYILTQYIMHMRQFFRLKIVSVMGNESRMHKEWHSNNNVVSDNYDFTIFANVKQKFEFANIDGIEFGEIDKMEQVVCVNGHNILLKHDVDKSTDKQKSTQSTIGKYYLQGNPITFILAGHIHTTRNTDLSMRSSSISGSNEYNENALGLIGLASQNILIVTKNSIHKIAIDLQNADENSGYDIIEQLEAYNAKSHDKATKKHTIFEIKAI